MDKNTIEFYNLRTRSKVAVDASSVTRHVSTRETTKGVQTRYQLKATSPDGHPLMKFVNKADYDALA